MSGNTITEPGGIAIVEGLLKNKVIRKIKLRLNPIGFKYTSEIESLLARNNKTLKKETTPNLQVAIKQLQTFEQRRDSVNEELARKKEELRLKRIDLEETLQQVERTKKVELQDSLNVEAKLEEVLAQDRRIESESHNLTKLFNE